MQEDSPGPTDWLSTDLPDKQQAAFERKGRRRSQLASKAPVVDRDSETAGCTLADVAKIVRESEWLWPDWVPLGYVTMIAGAPGVGKSVFVLHGLVAPVLDASKFTFPDDSTCSVAERCVIWYDTEFAQALLIQRARELELDLTSVHIPQPPNSTDGLSPVFIDQPEHWNALVDLVQTTRAPVVVIDSMLGAHGGNEAKSRDVARVMLKLAELARDQGIAIVIVDHLRKSREGEDINVVTLERIRDSGAKVQYSRSVIALDTPDPVNRDHVRAKVIKSNLCKQPVSVGMRIEDPGVAVWLDDAPETLEAQSRLDQAAEFIRDRLHGGHRLATEIKEEARADGIAEKTLERAKKKLLVESEKRDEGWFWRLPGTGADIVGN